MHPDEAAAILGIRLPCSKKEARSAYLRLLKVHKPDRDPEGFRRVREAWERLEGLGDPIGSWPSVASPRKAEPAQAEHREDAADGWVALWSSDALPPSNAPEPDAPDAPYLAPLQPEPPSDPLATFYARLEALGSESPEARVEVAREAVLAHPDLADAHWLLYDEMLDSGSPPRDVAKVLRDAHDRGLPGFFDELVASHADALEDDELERCAAESSDASASGLASELARRGRTPEAVAVALRSFSADGGFEIPVYAVHHLILSFVRRGDVEGSRALLEPLERHHRVRGDELRSPTLVGVPGTPLLRELVAVAGRLPEELRESVVDMLTLHGGDNGALVTAWAKAHSWQARRVRRLLKREAPFLHALVVPLMKAPPAAPAKQLDVSRFWWVAAIVVLHVFRAACSESSIDRARDQHRGLEGLHIPAPAIPPPPAPPATYTSSGEPPPWSPPEGYEDAGSNDPAAPEENAP